MEVAKSAAHNDDAWHGARMVGGSALTKDKPAEGLGGGVGADLTADDEEHDGAGDGA